MTAATVNVILWAIITITPGVDQPIDVGSRLELMVDGHLIDEMRGDARLTLHHPTPRQVAIVFNQPWEGSGCGYHSVFQDGDLYRMYHRGWQLTVGDRKVLRSGEPFLCYAESRDGIHWEKPCPLCHPPRKVLGDRSE